MPIRSVTLRILGDDRDALAALARVEVALRKLPDSCTIKIGLDGADQVISTLTGIRTRLMNLTKSPWNIVINTNADQAAAKVNDLSDAQKSAKESADEMAGSEEAAAEATDNVAESADRATRALLALAAAYRVAAAAARGDVVRGEGPTIWMGMTGIGGNAGRYVSGLDAAGAANDRYYATVIRVGNAELTGAQYGAMQLGVLDAMPERLAIAGAAADRFANSWVRASAPWTTDNQGGGGRGGSFSGFLGGLLGGMGMGGGKGPGAFGWAAIPLFGGLGAIGGLHLLVDGILEITATLLPAIAAMTAFGIAGSDAAMTIYNHFTDLHTVMDATGQAIPPMTGAMEALHRAVYPEVYQGLGDALTIMNSKTSEFATIAMGAGHALDYLAARATVALSSGGFSTFMRSAVSDLAKWGSVVGNIFGIFGNLLHSLPGYAAYILDALNGITHGIEVLTAQPVVQWALRAGLGLHGFAIYAGLAATGIMALTPFVSRIITGFAGMGRNGEVASTALKDLGTEASTIQQDASKVTFFDKFKAGLQDIAGNSPLVIGRLRGVATGAESVGAESGMAAEKVAALGAGFGVLGRLGIAVRSFAGAAAGVGLITAAVSEVIGTFNRLGNVAGFSPTQRWINGLQAGLARDPLQGLLPQINSDIKAVQDRLQTASKSFIIQPLASYHGNNPFDTFKTNVGSLFSGQGLTHDWQEFMANLWPGHGVGTSAFGELHAALQQLIQQRSQVTSFFQSVGTAVGGTGNAMGLMVTAGITSKQVLDATAAAAHGNAQPMLILKQEILATSQAYQAMGQRGGILGNDLQMLDRQTTDQYKAMQTLNQGWDTFTGNMTATQGTFDTFALGMKTLNNSATTVAHRLGDSTLTIHGLGNAMDGLTKKDLELNQAFTQQVSNANALFDTWRTAGLATNVFKGGVQGAVAELLKFAKGSPEALAQLTGLAQEAGYNGPAAFSKLSAWIGNTHDALLKMKQASDQATIQEALLTSAMRGQGQLISNQLIGDLNHAILATDGVQKATVAYGNAVARFGQQSSQAHAARQQLITDLIDSGKAAGDSNRQIATMIATVLKIPIKRALEIVETGTGHFSISQSYARASGALASGIQRQLPRKAAHGVFVHEGTTPTADDVVARVSRGELIVPAHMVSAGMVDHLRGMIPGFGTAHGSWHGMAGGGSGSNPMLLGNVGVLTGAATTAYDHQYISTFTAAMESSMTSAMRNAIASAAAASFGPGAPRGASGSAQRIAMSMLGRYGWGGQFGALNAVAMAESGWSMTARNPSSGAYGIAQFIDGPSEYYRYGGNPYSLVGQLVGFFNYIRSRYGSPDAAWAHERAFHWYGDGVRNAMFTHPTIIGVGDGGPELVNITPIHSPNSARMANYASGGGHGGGIHITVNGALDADSVARQVQKLLRQHQRHMGGKSLGF